jgi:signal transduction histidine kinase
MTIRKYWLVILISVAIISVAVNSLILSTLTDRYFKEFLVESYDHHINQIIDFTENSLSGNQISLKQITMEFEGHLTDPIIEIKLYSPQGDLLTEVKDDYHITSMMPGMMKNMMNRDTSNQINQYELRSNGKLIGVLHVTSHSLAENSFVARRFKASLLSNSLISVLFVTFLVVVLGIVISKKMSKSLIETAEIASGIQQGDLVSIPSTQIREVNAIRNSLEDLDVKLRLKQKSRKTLVDSLVHQTRTPLTILKTHIEAIEDGIIDASDKEYEICHNQIENLTNIISNVSGMIDASKEMEELKLEWVNIDQIIRQITSGLMTQFKSKSIDVEIVDSGKIRIKTDKYKLSQSIFNIITNAYKYTESKGKVIISSLIADSHAIIKIQDTGIGILDEDLERIFSAYYRAGDVNRVNGDGIGLYIARENIIQIGGAIEVKSKLGDGSTFIVKLPIDQNI